MTDEQHTESDADSIEIPEEFLDPEGDAELQDPALALEATTQDIRDAWRDWFRTSTKSRDKGPGKYVDVSFFGRGIGGVPAPAVDAYKALEASLRASGYAHGRSWAFNPRKIKNSDNWSLHSWGAAIDIDSKANPFTKGDPFAGRMQKVHVDAVLAIKNTAGRSVWSWGGYWSPRADRMHYQFDQPPSGMAIDWSTVPDWEPVEVPGANHTVDVKSTLNMRAAPTTSAAVVAALSAGVDVAVQAGAPTEADGHEWVKIKAAVGGKLGEGWVAKQFLKPIAGAAAASAPAAKAATETAATPAAAGGTPAATHIVNTEKDGLNLRNRASVSGDIVVELPKGSDVTMVGGSTEQADGYEWMNVSAVVGGKTVEGWVAAKYLKAIG